MASATSLNRLKKEYNALKKDPPPGTVARPFEKNFLHAHFLLFGDVFHDTPYEGGVYHGVLQFTKDYPYKPPGCVMRTPSGRFEVNKKICFSMSDYHPELWNPAWSIRTILTGLVSFMNSEEITTGGIKATKQHRMEQAKRSLVHCKSDKLVVEIFGDILAEIQEERKSLGNNTWPPPRLADAKKAAASVSRASRRAAKKKATVQKEEEEEENETLGAGEASSGSNLAKNRKKREREKRKKVAKKFLSTLSDQVPLFLSSISGALSERGIDVSHLEADHVCWRTESIEEYTELVTALKTSSATLLVESEIGGRLIATFELMEGIQATKQHTIRVVEIPAPKEGRPYKSRLEHVEFVIGDKSMDPGNDEAHRVALDDFIKRHPRERFDTRAREESGNPNVSLSLELEEFGTCAVKFHPVSLAKVIAYEQEKLRNNS